MKSVVSTFYCLLLIVFTEARRLDIVCSDGGHFRLRNGILSRTGCLDAESLEFPYDIGIRFIQQGTFALDKLHTIDLQYNNLTVIEENIFSDAPNLVNLELKGNQIRIIEDDLLQPTLEKLQFSRNHLEVVPRFSKNIRNLYLSSNRLTGTVVLAGYTSLIRAYLANNDIRQVVIANAPDLRIVNLRSNRNLNVKGITLDATLTQLTSLHIDQIGNMYSLNDDLFKYLPSLTSLYLSRNEQLEEIERGAFAAFSDGVHINLRDTSLSCCSIPGIYETTQRLQIDGYCTHDDFRYRLSDDVKFFEDSNCICSRFKTYVNETDSCEPLENCQNGHFIIRSGLLMRTGCEFAEELFEAQKSVERLDSNIFTNMTYLTTVNLENNKISEIAPGTFYNTNSLTALNLFGNLLTAFNDDISSSNLEYIDFGFNMLTAIPSFPGTTEYLDLSSNYLQNQVTFNDMPSLTVLNLANNNVSRLSLGNMPLLRTLDLSNNPYLWSAADLLLSQNNSTNNDTETNLTEQPVPTGHDIGNHTHGHNPVVVPNLRTRRETGSMMMQGQALAFLDAFEGNYSLVESLYLSNTGLTSLTSGMLDKFPQLTDIDITSNSLTFIGAGAFSNNNRLRIFDFSDSNLDCCTIPGVMELDRRRNTHVGGECQNPLNGESIPFGEGDVFLQAGCECPQGFYYDEDAYLCKACGTDPFCSDDLTNVTCSFENPSVECVTCNFGFAIENNTCHLCHLSQISICLDYESYCISGTTDRACANCTEGFAHNGTGVCSRIFVATEEEDNLEATNNNGRGISNTVIIVIATLAGLIIILAIVSTVFIVKKQRNKKEKDLLNGVSPMDFVMGDSKIELLTDAEYLAQEETLSNQLEILRNEDSARDDNASDYSKPFTNEGEYSVTTDDHNGNPSLHYLDPASGQSYDVSADDNVSIDTYSMLS